MSGEFDHFPLTQLLTVDKVIEGVHTLDFQKCVEMHVTADIKVLVVLLLDGFNVSIATFFTQQSTRTSGSTTLHARCILCALSICHDIVSFLASVSVFGRRARIGSTDLLQDLRGSLPTHL